MRSSILPDRILPFLDTHHKRLLLASLLLFVVLIPFQWIFPPITSGIVAFWLVFVLHSQMLRKWKLTLANPWTWLWAAYYIWIVLGVFYSPDPHEGWLDVTLKVTLFLWPLGFSGEGREVIRDLRKPVLRGFLIALGTSNLLLLILAAIDYQTTGSSQVFFYHNLARWEMIPMHYMALYNSFGAVIAWVLVMDEKDPRWKWVVSFVGVISILMVGLLSVRIQFIGLPIALFVATLLRSRHRRKAMIGLLSLMILLLIAILVLPGPRKRLSETFDEIASINGMVNNKQTNHRVFIWKYGAEVIRENPIMGVGTGGSEMILGEKFKECTAKFWNGTSNYSLSQFPYNFHNAFLQAWGTNGIAALLILLTSLVYVFIRGVFRKDGITTGFVILVVISFMTESMLERQAGVLFFGFFLSFLLFSSGKPKIE